MGATRSWSSWAMSSTEAIARLVRCRTLPCLALAPCERARLVALPIACGFCSHRVRYESLATSTSCSEQIIKHYKPGRHAASRPDEMAVHCLSRTEVLRPAGSILLLRELDRQARLQGGAVYMLNGNHESLNVAGNFRCGCFCNARHARWVNQLHQVVLRMGFEECSFMAVCLLSWLERCSCPVRDPYCCLVASGNSWPWVCALAAGLFMCEVDGVNSTTASCGPVQA